MLCNLNRPGGGIGHPIFLALNITGSKVEDRRRWLAKCGSSGTDDPLQTMEPETGL